MNDSNHLTITEVARPRDDGGLGLGKSRVYDLIGNGELSASKVDGRFVVNREEVERFLREYRPRINRPITFSDAVLRVASVLDGSTTMTKVAKAYPSVSVSYVSLMVRGKRWPEVRERALEIVAEQKETSQNE